MAYFRPGLSRLTFSGTQMMKGSEIPDPLVDEVRSIRKELSERFGNDVDRLCEHLESVEKTVGERLVRRRVKKAAKADSK